MNNETKQPTVSNPLEHVVSSDFGDTKDPVILMVADMIRVSSVSQGHQHLIAKELVRQGWTKSC
jgi:hypothetical protein